MDYRKYRAGFVEKLACAAVGAGAAGMAAWLFYRSVWGMLLFPAAYLVCVKKYCALQKEKRKEQLLREFKDAMQSASAALLAGYSVENAWRETEKELLELHGEKGFMAAEVRWMNEGVRMNEPLERLLLSFAARSGCEEIESFAEVFAFAKRSGGDFVHIIMWTKSPPLRFANANTSAKLSISSHPLRAANESNSRSNGSFMRTPSFIQRTSAAINPFSPCNSRSSFSVSLHAFSTEYPASSAADADCMASLNSLSSCSFLFSFCRAQYFFTHTRYAAGNSSIPHTDR